MSHEHENYINIRREVHGRCQVAEAANVSRRQFIITEWVINGPHKYLSSVATGMLARCNRQAGCRTVDTARSYANCIYIVKCMSLFCR